MSAALSLPEAQPGPRGGNILEVQALLVRIQTKLEALKGVGRAVERLNGDRTPMRLANEAIALCQQARNECEHIPMRGME